MGHESVCAKGSQLRIVARDGTARCTPHDRRNRKEARHKWRRTHLEHGPEVGSSPELIRGPISGHPEVLHERTLASPCSKH